MIGESQFQFRTARRRLPRQFRGLGSLIAHDLVFTLQLGIRNVLAWGRAQSDASLHFSEPSGFAIDGKYGSATQLGLKRMVNVLVRGGFCTEGYHPADIDSNGPNAVGSCVMRSTPIVTGINSAVLAACQSAWSEWKTALSSSSPPPAEPAVHPDTTPTDATPVVPITPPSKDEGMGTGEWILLLLLGAGVVGGAYYIFSD